MREFKKSVQKASEELAAVRTCEKENRGLRGQKRMGDEGCRKEYEWKAKEMNRLHKIRLDSGGMRGTGRG